VRARLARIPLPLVVLLAIAGLEAFGWAVATAPLDGPDEIAHVSYVQNLAERGRAPAFASGDGTESTEVASALNWATLRSNVGVPTIKPSSSPADEATWHEIEESLRPDARKNAGGPNAVAKNPPLYYLWESVPYRIGRSWPLFDRLFLMRLGNALLLMGTVLFAWLAGGELFTSLWRRTALCAFVALQPQLAFMGGVVNPDTLLTLIWTAFLFAALRLVVRGPTFWRVVGMLATVVASALTQGRGLPLVPAGVIVLALALWRHRPIRMPVLAGVGAGALIAGGALAVYRATLGAGSHAYGAEIAFRSPRPFSLWEYVSQTWQFYLPKLPGMRPWLGPHYRGRQLWDETFWGTFGSLDVHFSPQVYDVLQAVMICLAIGVPIALVMRRGTVRWDVVAVLGVMVVGLVLFLHLASYRNLLGTDDPLLVGRYLLPLVAPIGVAFIFVLDLLPSRGAIYGMAALLSIEAFLGLSGLALSLVRFYG
jgi:hypothetical protein